MSHTRGWRVWFLWITCGFLLFSLICYSTVDASQSTGTLHSIIFKWIRRITAIGTYSLLPIGSATLAASFLIYQRRLKWLVVTALIICGFKLMIEVYYHVSPESKLYYTLLGISTQACSVACLALLVFFLPLQDRHRWIQTATVIFVVLLWIITETQLLSIDISNMDMVNIFKLLLMLAAVVGVSVVTYLGLFHRAMVAPLDTANRVTLTCPRCNTAQLIPINGGNCLQCHLRINITLAEGTCPKCHYILRGLTNGICPECGTQIGNAAAAESPIRSAVAANIGDPAT